MSSVKTIEGRGCRLAQILCLVSRILAPRSSILASLQVALVENAFRFALAARDGAGLRECDGGVQTGDLFDAVAETFLELLHRADIVAKHVAGDFDADLHVIEAAFAR